MLIQDQLLSRNLSLRRLRLRMFRRIRRNQLQHKYVISHGLLATTKNYVLSRVPGYQLVEYYLCHVHESNPTIDYDNDDDDDDTHLYTLPS